MPVTCPVSLDVVTLRSEIQAGAATEQVRFVRLSVRRRRNEQDCCK